MFVLSAGNISRRKKMVLTFPHRAVTSITPSLSSTRIIVTRNSTRTPNSRPFSQHSQPSRMIILLTCIPSKMNQQEKPDEDIVDDDEDVHAFLGMFGALKE
jgi:hypothetical protein